MTMDKLFDGSDAHLLGANAELIANLRGENLDCNCCAYSRSECSCDTCWPESFTNKAADALEAADKRIAELEQTNCSRLDEAERKLAVAREALRELACLGNGSRYGNSIGNNMAMKALAQIGGGDEQT